MLIIVPLKKSFTGKFKTCSIGQATSFGIYDQQESNLNNWIALFKDVRHAMLFANFTSTKRINQ